MMNPTDNAFPWDDVGPHPGLTKREYIAIHAPQEVFINIGSTRDLERDLGLLEGHYDWKIHLMKVYAMQAVRFADALIAELNKK